MKKSMLVGPRVLLAVAAMTSVALVAPDAWAQEKQKYSFRQPSDAVGKYMQQLAVDVGDVPGHQVRVRTSYHLRHRGTDV
jgi:hypothetical protein